jgi:transcriptional regulator with XRE-family HTH domain
MLRLGQKLKAERLALGLSAMNLACRHGAQVSDETVFNNERGLKNVGLMTLCRHAQALGADVVDYLTEVRQGLTPPR